jgi:hypothetical protein
MNKKKVVEKSKATEVNAYQPLFKDLLKRFPVTKRHQ